MRAKGAIRDFILANISKDKAMELADDAPLLTSGLVDSLGIVRLVVFIEDDLGIKVPLEDITIENFETLELLDAYLTTRRGTP